MRLWGRRSAFNVQKVLWTAAELGLDFEHVDVGGDAGGLDTREFLAMNPHGRIPVLRDGDAVIWESHAIVRYLAARYGAGTLWPRDPVARSHADRWMDWSQTALQPDFMALFWGFYRTPEAQRRVKSLEVAAQSCAAHFEKLDAHLAERRFLAGDSFTMGDVPAGTTLHRYFEMGFPVPEPPHVREWRARLTERKAYRSHVQLPFEELHGRLSF